MEQNAYRLTDRRDMHDYVPFILKDEEIDGKPLSIIFDSTSRLREAFAIVVCFVKDDLSIHRMFGETTDADKISNRRRDYQS